ncbi:MAG: toxin-activating lysine-acyltransferase [Pseudomonadota bacterium]
MADTPTREPRGKQIPEDGPARTMAQSFSDIITILIRTEPFRDMPLKDLEWLVVPALMRHQFALAHATKNETNKTETPESPNGESGDKDGPPMPVGLVMWASVSPDVDAKFRADKTSALITMAREDWASGDIPWIIVAAGMPQVLKTMVGQVAGRVFKGKPVNIRVGDGKSFRVETLRTQESSTPLPN